VRCRSGAFVTRTFSPLNNDLYGDDTIPHVKSVFAYRPVPGTRVVSRSGCCKCRNYGFFNTILWSLYFWLQGEFVRLFAVSGSDPLKVFFATLLPSALSFYVRLPSKVMLLVFLCILLFSLWNSLFKSFDRFCKIFRSINDDGVELELSFDEFFTSFLRKHYKYNFCFGFVQILDYRVALFIHGAKFIISAFAVFISLLFPFIDLVYSENHPDSTFCNFMCSNGTI